MTEQDASDFKMFEKAPFEAPPAKGLTELIINGVREVENIYGQVFTLRFIKYALKFITQKTWEVPTQYIKDLDQLTEYLISKSDKYATPYCAAAYAQWRTENEFQGRTGAGTRVAAIASTRSVSKRPGIEERNVDIDATLFGIRETLTAMGCCPSEWGYKKNKDKSVDIIVPKCHFMDGCRKAVEEGLLKRLNGKRECVVATGWCILLKLSTNYEWDYKLLEFDKPYCIQNCYML